MKKLLLALVLITGTSALAADRQQVSISGRIAEMSATSDVPDASGRKRTRLIVRVKDVCPIFPGLNQEVRILNRKTAVLRISLTEQVNCSTQKETAGFQLAIYVEDELARAGIDADGELLISLK